MEIISINKAAKNLFGQRKSSWANKSVEEFFPDINLKRKDSKLNFIYEGKSKPVLIASSKLKFANELYYLIAINDHPVENFDSRRSQGPTQAGNESVNEKELPMEQKP